MTKAAEPQSLEALLSWYRFEVEGRIPTRIHNRETSEGGAKEWHARFKAYLLAHPKATDEDGYVRDPLAFWLWTLSSGGPKNRRRGEFLYRLAVMDFDWLEAVHARRSFSKWAADMAEDYTVASLRILWDKMQREPVIRSRERAKSDAQKDAEAAT